MTLAPGSPRAGTRASRIGRSAKVLACAAIVPVLAFFGIRLLMLGRSAIPILGLPWPWPILQLLVGLGCLWLGYVLLRRVVHALRARDGQHASAVAGVVVISLGVPITVLTALIAGFGDPGVGEKFDSPR